MKEIIKLLKSIQFWLAAITLVVTAIAASPVIENWMMKAPVVYFGKENKLEEGKPIIVNYIIPTGKVNRKVRFSFPIFFANENNIMLENFFISLKAPVINIPQTRLSLFRFSPYADFYALSGRKNDLLKNNGQYINSRGIQEDGNPEAGINFIANGFYKDVFIINMCNSVNTEVWDEFDFPLIVGASNCKTKEYDFTVRCYVVDDVEKKKAEIMKMKKSANGQYFVVTPSFYNTDMTADSIVVSRFDVDSEDVTNLIIRY